MSRSRVPLVLGGTAVAGVGYYLYTAGGDRKVAQKQAEGKEKEGEEEADDG
jgi:hypothetical protein